MNPLHLTAAVAVFTLVAAPALFFTFGWIFLIVGVRCWQDRQRNAPLSAMELKALRDTLP